MKRHEHDFHQSWLSGFEMCPEQRRLELLHPEARIDTDSSLYGTAVHESIEVSVDEYVNNGTALSHASMVQVFERTLKEGKQKEGGFYDHVPYEQTKKTSKASLDLLLRQGSASLAQWRAEVLPLLNPRATEVKFDKLLLLADDERRITVSGLMDYVDYDMGLVDWKTGGRAYEEWEKQRWAVQPTMYTFAAVQLGLIEQQPLMPFTYFVMVRGGPIQRLTVTRSTGDWAWLKRRAVNAARMIESDLPEWPLNDGGWWCHPNWCAFFDGCKGSSYEPDNVPVWITRKR